MKNRAKRESGWGHSSWLLLLIAALALLSACSRSKAGPPDTTVVETNSDPNVFTMDNPGQFALAPVEVRKVRYENPVNGVVSPNVNRSVAVLSLGAGKVVEIKNKLGDNRQQRSGPAPD